jgi:hypothetical protein
MSVFQELRHFVVKHLLFHLYSRKAVSAIRDINSFKVFKFTIHTDTC